MIGWIKYLCIARYCLPIFSALQSLFSICICKHVFQYQIYTKLKKEKFLNERTYFINFLQTFFLVPL